MLTNLKRSAAIFLFSLAAFAAITAQTAPDTSTGKTERNLRTHIEYLASDKLEGRRTGEPGAALASEYVAAQFNKLKLKTLGADGSYFQPFPYVTGVEKAAGNEFRL